MERDVQSEPVILNYASAQKTAPSHYALIILVALASMVLCPVLYSAFVALTTTGCTGCGGDTLTKAQMDSLSSVLALYQLHLHAYPTSLDDLLNSPDRENSAKWRGPYVESEDRLKDGWGRRIRYRFPGLKNRKAYDLWSVGLDGVAGTADDICNW